MCLHSIFPRVGSLENINTSDLCIIYHLMNKKPLNINYLIINHMMKVAENPMKSAIVPYGMTLNKVFKRFKVPLKDENIDTNYISNL